MKLMEKIKEIRLVEGYTQKNFAELLEVDERSIQNYESNKTTPNALIIEKLCMEFPEYAYWLMTGNVEPDNNHISPDIKMQINTPDRIKR